MGTLLKNFLTFLGSDKIILGVCSLIGILSFIITILTYIRTSKITQILKYNALTTQYNKERKGYQETFDGHRSSIEEDGNKTDRILKNILKNVEEYQAKFGDMLPLSEKISLWRFKKMLKKEAVNVDFNDVCNHLAILSGRLSKKEDIKNG